MKNINIILLFFLYFTLCFSQAPAISWQKTYGGSNSDNLKSFLLNSDGTIYVGGTSTSPISGDKTVSTIGSNNREFWILTINPLGEINTQYSTIHSQPQYYSYAYPYTSFHFFDNKFFIGSTPWDYDVYEMNVNYFDITTGAAYIGFDPGYNGGCGVEYISSNCGLVDFFKSIDGTYICSGTTTSSCTGYNYDYFLAKKPSLVTSSFAYWKRYSGSNSDLLSNTIQTSDAGFLLLGYSNSNISGIKTENSNGGYDYWIIKTDSNGNVIWQNTIGGSSSEESISVAQTSDGGYIIGGSSNSNVSGDKTENSRGGYDYWIVKLDAAGTILWQKTIGGNLDDKLAKIIPTNDNGYIAVGTSSSTISGDKTEDSRGLKDNWVVKLNNYGNVMWDKTIGGAADDIANDIIQNNDSSYVIGSTSSSPASGDKAEDSKGLNDYWIIKLDPETLTNTENIFSTQIEVFPNPTNEIVRIKFQNKQEKATISVYNLLGQMLKTETITNTNSSEISFDFDSGIYLLEIQNQENQKALIKICKD